MWLVTGCSLWKTDWFYWLTPWSMEKASKDDCDNFHIRYQVKWWLSFPHNHGRENLWLQETRESLIHTKIFPSTYSILLHDKPCRTSQPLGMLTPFPTDWCDSPDSSCEMCLHNACLPNFCVYKSTFTWRTGTPHLCCQIIVSHEEPAKCIIALPNAYQFSRRVTRLVGNVSLFSSWCSPDLKCLWIVRLYCHQRQLAQEITPWKKQVIRHFCETCYKSILKPAFYL